MQLQLNYFDFSGLPGRKNNLPALDARRAWKSLSPKTDTDDLNSFKSSSEKKNNLFVIHCSRNSYMEWHRFHREYIPHCSTNLRMKFISGLAIKANKGYITTESFTPNLLEKVVQPKGASAIC